MAHLVPQGQVCDSSSSLYDSGSEGVGLYQHTRRIPKMKARITATGFAVAGLALSAMLPSVAAAADSLEALGANPNNWTMQTGDYTGQHYSRLSQITTGNVKNLKAAWSFSTGLLHGHEGAPLVIGDMMYINTHFQTIHLPSTWLSQKRLSGSTNPSRMPPSRRLPAVTS